MIKNGGQTILVVDDVEETLDGIEELLKRDGYRVAAARNEIEATDKARLRSPELMLVSLDGEIADVIAAAERIRERALLNEDLPIVVFCVGELQEGGEAAIGHNIYLAHPDNFNQLRDLIASLLLDFSNMARV
jgi:CheY-like chemotaxis protein